MALLGDGVWPAGGRTAVWELLMPPGEEHGGLRRARSGGRAAALGRVVDDDTLARALGARARARVEGAFSLDAVGGRWAALLAGGS